jgi:transposase
LAGGAEATARRDAVLAFVGVLRALNQAIRDLDRSVIARLGEHPDSKIFASLPRSGQINAAQLLACWGDCRDAYDGPEAVAGIVPVTASPASTPRCRSVGRATSASATP